LQRGGLRGGGSRPGEKKFKLGKPIDKECSRGGGTTGAGRDGVAYHHKKGVKLYLEPDKNSGLHRP